MANSSIIVAIVLLALSTAVNSLGISLRYGEQTCIRENVIKAEYLAGEFTVEPTSRRVAVEVKDPLNTVVYHKAAAYEGSFAFTSLENGEYKVCFSNTVENNGSKIVRFKFSNGAEAKSVSVAKTKNLKPLEAQVLQLETILAGVKTDQEWLNGMRGRMNDLNQGIMSQVVWFNIVLTILLVSLTFAQVYYLRHYFRSKKIVAE